MDTDHVIIVGTGAGGGTLARHLAPSGKRILLLERGDWLPRELENWLTEAVFVDNRYVSPDTWYDENGTPFQPGVHYFVGGATKLYGAALYRLRKEDFGELQHHDGISPAWPISYEELEPYYTLAEQLYHVHGARGEDPTEPPSSAPYPHPAVRTSHGSSSSPTTSQLRATGRSTRRAGSCSTSRTCPSARAFAVQRVTAFPASCTPSPTPRYSASGRPSSTRT
jgi:choline dehydrogenase-like flavoprotein